jgi:hypothetical protein
LVGDSPMEIYLKSLILRVFKPSSHPSANTALDVAIYYKKNIEYS